MFVHDPGAVDGLVPPAPPVWSDGADAIVWDGACGECAACRVGRPAACRAPVPPPEGVSADGERARRRVGAAVAAAAPAALAAGAAADELVRELPAGPAAIVLGDGIVARACATAAAAAGGGPVAVLGDLGPADAGAPAPDVAAGGGGFATLGELGPAGAGAPAPDAAARARGDGAFASTDRDAVRAWIAARAPRGRADVVLAVDGDLATAARLVRRGGWIAAVGRVPARLPHVTTLVQRELELLAPRDLVRGALTCVLPAGLAADPESEPRRSR